MRTNPVPALHDLNDGQNSSNTTQMDVELAKRFLADHRETFSGENRPNRNTLCGHVDLDARGSPEWSAGPFYPTGAYDGKGYGHRPSK